jgi:hypothetical protein
MPEMEHDLGRLGDAPILPYIIGRAFPIGELGLASPTEVWHPHSQVPLKTTRYPAETYP